MFTRVKDFESFWLEERKGTMKVLEALTDASLAQEVSPEDRTLGRIAWHLTTSIPEMMNRTGLALEGPDEHAPVPANAREIARVYELLSTSLENEIRRRWNDATLLEEDDMYGDRWARGKTLAILIHHQAHHRGQMTVLMRQAGVKVPGVYGPAREEWTAYGMSAPEV